VADRSALLPSTILAEGFACMLLVPYGVRCENEYQAISSACPSSQDKSDWIFSMLFKFTGSCSTTPGATTLMTRRSLSSQVAERCLERGTTPDTCVSDRTQSLTSTIIAQGYACDALRDYGVECERDYVKIAANCPNARDMADWVFSTHFALTGTCHVKPSVSLLVTRNTLASSFPAVKEQCLGRIA
jgi:hypothetical protein